MTVPALGIIARVLLVAMAAVGACQRSPSGTPNSPPPRQVSARPSDAATAETVDPETSPAPAPPATTPCPGTTELHRLACTALGTGEDGSESTVAVASCREARLPAPGWLVHVEQSPGGEETAGPVVQLLLAVPCDATTRPAENGAGASVVWSSEFPSPEAAEFHDASAAVVDTADLDGDGTDEVLLEESSSYYGEFHTRIGVYRMAAGALRQVGEVTTSFDDAPAQADETAASECRATVEVGAALPDGSRPLVVEGTVRRGATADPDRVAGCIEGAVRLRLANDALVQLPAGE